MHRILHDMNAVMRCGPHWSSHRPSVPEIYHISCLIKATASSAQCFIKYTVGNNEKTSESSSHFLEDWSNTEFSKSKSTRIHFASGIYNEVCAVHTQILPWANEGQEEMRRLCSCPETPCISYFCFALIKCHGQENLSK